MDFLMFSQVAVACCAPGRLSMIGVVSQSFSSCSCWHKGALAIRYFLCLACRPYRLLKFGGGWMTGSVVGKGTAICSSDGLVLG